ncbi:MULTISPECIES: substrate-binding periplasmic protein [unclassified Janthinobacterium]|uniref:substrate-binding periplasmic protein n=1 Tax=unclassified Janthinobacterium TaxID=2610881 RepID=UPI0012F8B516|nr:MULTISPECIES: transporter substrate-binding domain-containing protein [unclassified Janthinobacterium]MEC5161145.1 polar amino acid transport system substrate-binding protein [Janthinobacterium sp. CG_S6]
MNNLGKLMLGSAALVVQPCPAAAEQGPIQLRVLAQESIPPKWVIRGGRMDGLCPDILAAIEKIEPRVRFSGYADYRSLPVIEQSLSSGAVGAACALLDTPRRQQIARIVGQPLYSVRHRLAAASAETAMPRNFDELIKLKPLIATPRGASYSEQLRVMGLAVDDSTGDNMVNLKKVAAGHGRFFYMNELTMGWLLQSDEVRGKVRMLPGVLKEEPIYFWISKKADPAAAAIVERAIDRLHANGEMARIYKRWADGR